MKTKVSVLFVLIICIIFSSLPFGTTAAETDSVTSQKQYTAVGSLENNAEVMPQNSLNMLPTASLEQIIAGLAAPSELFPSTTESSSLRSIQLIESGIYYINNQLSGKYIKDNNASPAMQSGLIQNLQTSIEWKIVYLGQNYAIRSASDPTKCLAVMNDSSIGFITVTGIIPLSCQWEITLANGGGTLIKSAYNSQYLDVINTTLTLASTLPTPNSFDYFSNVWRIGTPDFIEPKELSPLTEFYNRTLLMGYTDKISYRLWPEDAIWEEAYNFLFTVDNGSIAYIDRMTGTITPLSQGTTRVVCRHLPTDRVFSFDITVRNNNLTYKGTLTYFNSNSNFIGKWEYSPSLYINDYSNSTIYDAESALNYAVSDWNDALDLNMNITTNGLAADIRVFAGTYDDIFDNLGEELPESVAGRTHYITTYSTGYYEKGTLAKIERTISSVDVIIILTPGRTADDYYNIILHELGHALGYFGHNLLNSTAIMYPYIYGNTEIDTDDIVHLSQMY